MDLQQQHRGRSPSVDNKNRNLNPSHSPHPQYRDHVSALGLDPVPANANFSTGLFMRYTGEKPTCRKEVPTWKAKPH